MSKISSLPYIRLVDEDFLRPGRLPDVPDADNGAAVQTHGAGRRCGAVNRHHGEPLHLGEVHQADAATCRGGGGVFSDQTPPILANTNEKAATSYRKGKAAWC